MLMTMTATIGKGKHDNKRCCSCCITPESFILIAFTFPNNTMTTITTQIAVTRKTFGKHPRSRRITYELPLN
jgi:hypothetical protein